LFLLRLTVLAHFHLGTTVAEFPLEESEEI
jgi:hypothetical protein